jgi:hypothetical protein
VRIVKSFLLLIKIIESKIRIFLALGMLNTFIEALSSQITEEAELKELFTVMNAIFNGQEI